MSRVNECVRVGAGAGAGAITAAAAGTSGMRSSIFLTTAHYSSQNIKINFETNIII